MKAWHLRSPRSHPTLTSGFIFSLTKGTLLSLLSTVNAGADPEGVDWLASHPPLWGRLSNEIKKGNKPLTEAILVVYHLQQLSGNSGWKVNGTRLFGSFQWKISGTNGTSEKVLLFFRTECSKRKFVYHLFKPNLLIPVSGSRSHFLSQQQLIRELNGKENVAFKMTSQSLKLLGDYSDSFNLSNAVELSRSWICKDVSVQVELVRKLIRK